MEQKTKRVKKAHQDAEGCWDCKHGGKTMNEAPCRYCDQLDMWESDQLDMWESDQLDMWESDQLDMWEPK